MQAKGKEIDEEKMFANDRLKVEILKSDQTSFFIKYFVTKKFIKTPIIIMYSAFKIILVVDKSCRTVASTTNYTSQG